MSEGIRYHPASSKQPCEFGVKAMRRAKQSKRFLLCFLLNVLLNLEWSVPAWILLVLHFWLKFSVWWFVGGLVFWILGILVDMWIIGWATACGNQKDPPKENKNPYSVKQNQDTPGGGL